MRAVWVVALLCTGCASSVTVVVNLRTDFLPVTEITGMRTTLDAVEIDHLPRTGETWATGARVAEFDAVAPGPHVVGVQLYDGARLVSEDHVAITVTADYAVTIVLTRSCVGVICPRAGDPSDATTCVDGHCIHVSPTCVPDCTGRECGPDPTCGRSCGPDCTVGATCDLSGRCACPGGQSYCDGACVDLGSDLAHCGACGRSCAGGACEFGTCACPFPTVLCPSGCVDTATDAMHCGSCTTVCDPMMAPTCCAGTCSNLSEPMHCGMCSHACMLPTPDCCTGACTNLDNDSSNCGMCGNHCDTGSGQSCSARSCG